MKTKFILSVLAVFSAVVFTYNLRATPIACSANGSWNATATWTPAQIPGVNDDVTIPAGKSVTGLGTAQSCKSLTITGNGAITLDAFAFTVTGTTAIVTNGTITISSATGAKAFNGDISIGIGGIWNNTGNAAVTYAGNVANFGTFNSGTGVQTFNSSSKTISGIIGIANVTVTSPGSLQNNGKLTVSNALAGTGTFVNSAAGTLVVSNGSSITVSSFTPGNTVIYTASTPVPLTASYGNLIVTNSGNFNVSGISSLGGYLGIFGQSGTITWPSSLSLGSGIIWNDSTTASSSSAAITMNNNSSFGGSGTALLTLTGVVNDGGLGYSFTKMGTDSLTLAPATPETFTGSTMINGGTLTLDYANASTPANGIINGSASSALVFGNNYLGGGTLTLNGKSGITASQTFNGVTLSAGGNTISNNVNGSTSSTLALGTIATRGAGAGTVDFGSTDATVAGPITTSNANNSAGILGGWATFAGSDWARVNGSGQIVAFTNYTTLPASNVGSQPTVNYSSANSPGSVAGTINSLKLTTGTVSLGGTLTLGSGANGGLLVTGTAALTPNGQTITAGAGNELVVYVKSGATMTVNFNGNNNILIGANSGSLTKSGAGTLTLNDNGGTPAFTGPTVINQGTINVASVPALSSSTIQIGAGATLQGGNASFTIGGGSSTQILTGSGLYAGNSGGGALVLGAHAVVYPGGNGTYGTLVVGGSSGASVTINSGAVLAFDLSKDPNNTNKNDQLVYNYGSASLTVPAILNITINQPDGVLGIGTYTLIDASFNSTGLSQTPTVAATWTGGSAPANYNFAVVNKKLVLNVYSACAPPTLYSVTGGTNCSGTGASVGLSGSDSTATYQLQLNGVNSGSAVAGTGSALSPGAWANQIAVGTYSVVGTSGCGTALTMSGQAVVSQAPNTTYSLTGANGCSSSGVVMGLSGSDVGVTYELLADSTVVTNVAGTGSAISFGLQKTAATYTVMGTNAGCGAVAINGGTPSSFVITATPNAPTGVAAVAGDSQVTLNWTAPVSGPAPTGYNVYRSTTSGSGYGLLGAGANVTSPFIDSTAVNGTAYYYVVTSLDASCESTNSQPEAAATPNPAFSAFTMSDANSGLLQAGVPDGLTITAVNSDGTTASGVTGDIALTFSGLGTPPSGNVPTVTDKNGTARVLGAATIITFANGVGTVGGTLVDYREEAASLHVTDGTHSSTSAGSPGDLVLSVSPAADSAYRITAATNAPAVGSADALTIALVDQYQNVSAFTGIKNITFGGLSAGPDGSLPTVTDNTSTAQNFGAATAIHFTSGVNDAGGILVAHKVENSKLITATDGSLSASGTGGAAPTLSPTVGAPAALTISTQPSATATAGVALATQPVLKITDANGNQTTSGASVTVTASAGTVQGTTSINAVNGTATFAGLSLTNSGVITLTFASTNLPSTNSVAITVAAGNASRLGWVTQPGLGSPIYNTSFQTQPVLETLDSFGNPSTTGLLSNMVVTVSVSSGNGSVSGTATGDIGSAAGNGFLTFTNLGVKGTGTNFQLSASLSGNAGFGAPPSGMALWLDSSINGSVLVDTNGQVTNWMDLSGNSNNFSQLLSSGTGSITYNTTVVAGRKSVSFHNNGAANARELINTTYRNSTSTISVFVAAKKRPGGSSAGTERVFATQQGAADDYNNSLTFEMDYGGGNVTPLVFRGNGNRSQVSFDPTSTWHTFGYIATATGNTVSINTIGGGTLTGGTSGSFAAFGPTKAAVGGGLTGSGGIQNNPFDGDVAEVLVYNSDMSSQRTAIQTYLATKWQYSLSNAVSATFAVNPLPVMLSGTRGFDGTSVVEANVLSVTNAALGDDVAVASGEGSLSGSGLGVQTITDFGTLALGGVTGSNYTLAGGSGSVTITGSTPFAVNSSENPSGYLDSINFTATLSSLATGNVIFSANGTPFSTNVLSGGVASSDPIASLPRGTNIVSAQYSGDSNYLAETNTLAGGEVVTNHPPIAGTVTYSAVQGTTSQFAISGLLTHVTDQDRDTVTFTGISASADGAALTNDSTYIYYTPAPNTTNDSFNYFVTDGFGGNTTGLIMVNITRPGGGAGTNSIVLNGTAASITVHGLPNYNYVLQTTTNLTAPWFSIATNAADANGVVIFSDPNATNAQQYYRSVVQP